MKTALIVVVDAKTKDALELCSELNSINAGHVVLFDSMNEARATFVQDRNHYSRATLFLKDDGTSELKIFLRELMGDELLSEMQIVLTRVPPTDESAAVADRRTVWAMRAGAVGLVRFPLDRKVLERVLNQIKMRRLRVS